MKKIERQEMERLLYVALTRARHTLVLALDADFFRGKRGVHSDTQLKWLQADANEPNAETISNLSDQPTACEQTAARQKQRAPEPITDNLSALRLETGWVHIARQKAASIIETVTPSQFVPEEELGQTPDTEQWIEMEPELRAPRIDNPATRYGVWWHDFAEQIPWSEPKNWNEIFERSAAASPDVARSKREWQLLQQHIKSQNGLGHLFHDANLVRQEMPFFWRMHEHERKCVEGIIDLALLQAGKKKWFIVDWKTNRIERNQTDKLRAHYRPQIAAYWKAVTEITNQSVGAAIYSTSTGQLLLYDENELAIEWQRLKNLPATDLGYAIADIE
jgi:ATP-dependent exoDNAse (exonuclease V) beta subunit